MRCIFCLKNRPGTKEHIFPLAIGGRLTIDRVCVSCNSMLGTRVDAALSNSFMVRLRRADLGLAGNSGTAPTQHEILLGDHTLASDPNHKVRVALNKRTGKLDIRTLYQASDLAMYDGAIARQIILDERDFDKIPKIIQRERKRRNLPALGEKELAQEIKDFRRI